MQSTNLDFDVLRNLAFMQYNKEQFFILNDVAYEGTQKEAFDEYQLYLVPLQMEGKEADDFDQWVADNCLEIGEFDNDNYLVLTDEEADEKWDEYLESYIDECLEIPKHIERYFDREAWKTDARYDGRGHSLSSYDGNENEETVLGETFYIFRQN